MMPEAVEQDNSQPQAARAQLIAASHAVTMPRRNRFVPSS